MQHEIYIVGKNKLKRFAELEELDRVFQPGSGFRDTDYPLKGKWCNEVFQNQRPLILELGCGRGEYSIHMGKMFPDRNFIGIDKKGARLWRGAKTSNEDQMYNTAFLRIQIEHLESFFAPGEADEIWITFPDPQPQISREKNRMTSPRFLAMYHNILKPNGKVHLKTDSEGLFNYTVDVIRQAGYRQNYITRNLYNEPDLSEILKIQTTYEKRFLKEGMNIYYLNFSFS